MKNVQGGRAALISKKTAVKIPSLLPWLDIFGFNFLVPFTAAGSGELGDNGGYSKKQGQVDRDDPVIKKRAGFPVFQGCDFLVLEGVLRSLDPKPEEVHRNLPAAQVIIDPEARHDIPDRARDRHDGEKDAQFHWPTSL